MSLRLRLFWWKGTTKFEHNLKALDNRVNIKFDLQDTETKLSKFVKTLLNATLPWILAEKLLLTLLNLILINDIVLFSSISDVNLILGC